MAGPAREDPGRAADGAGDGAAGDGAADRATGDRAAGGAAGGAADGAGDRAADSAADSAADQAGDRAGDGAAGAARRGGPAPAARRLYATVLVMEAIVTGLAIPVAIKIEHVHAGLAGIVGGAVAAVAIILAGAAARGSRAAVRGGTVLQALLVAAGFEVKPMLVLGVVFAALWAACIWLARRMQAS